jgi:hypothetical protein
MKSLDGDMLYHLHDTGKLPRISEEYRLPCFFVEWSLNCILTKLAKLSGSLLSASSKAFSCDVLFLRTFLSFLFSHLIFLFLAPITFLCLFFLGVFLVRLLLVWPQKSTVSASSELSWWSKYEQKSIVVHRAWHLKSSVLSSEILETWNLVWTSKI